MKMTFLFFFFFSLFSCGETDINQEQKKPTALKSKAVIAKDNYILITFDKGPLAGTHRFIKKQGSFTSNIAVGYFDDKESNEMLRNNSNFNANGLVSKEGEVVLEYLTRPFTGEASPGDHQAIKTTNTDGNSDCGLVKFRDENNSFKFDKIRGAFVNCSATSISGVSEWKDGTVKKRRTVEGNFEDQIKLEIVNDDESIETITVNIKIEFNAKESRMK